MTTTPPTLSDAFPAAIAFVLGHEGGFSDDPADSGGPTRWGVSLAWLRKAGLLDLDHDGRPDGDVNGDGAVDAEDVRVLPRDHAIRLYRLHWWDALGYARITDPAIAAKTFDLAVNMGAAAAHRCLQRALRAAWFPVADDGQLGPKSLAAINAADPRSLMPAFKSEAAGHYRVLIAARPVLATFENGWLNRAYAQPL